MAPTACPADGPALGAFRQDNWQGEQAIRPAVVNRKVWDGKRSWPGAETQSRIMSVLRTAAQRGLDPIEYLVRTARAPVGEPVWLFYNTT